MPSQLYLASRSPRRSQLLAQLQLSFEIVDGDVDERVAPGQLPEDYVLAMARGKAEAGARNARDDLPVLGADTEVVIDGEVLGKPASRAHAVAMLKRLSGREHRVLSAIAIVQGDRRETALSRTAVQFGEITDAQAAAYWDSGEPADKAGAYAIQGRGAQFVREIRGSYSGVMGLPLFETAELLARFGVRPL